MRTALTLLLAIVLSLPAAAQSRRVAISGDRLSGFALPVTPLNGDVGLNALRAWAWTVDDTKRLSLRGDVDVRIANHTFSARDAEVWINRVPVGGGAVTQIAIYFEDLGNPQRAAGVGAAGRRMLVTACVTGTTTLDAALVEREESPASSMRRRAEERLARHLRGLAARPPRLSAVPRVDPTERNPAAFVPTIDPTDDEDESDLPRAIEVRDLGTRRPWLRAPEGTVTFSADDIEVSGGDSAAGLETIAIASGSIFVEYFDDGTSQTIQQLTLTAERAVVFAEPGSLDELANREIDVQSLRGVYLEGNVTASADEGEQIVRAPRMYYDFTLDRAIMLDAVLRTYSRERNVPIYARAAELRQIAEDQWTAREVRVAASEYEVGHIALGAERMTVSRRPIEPGADPPGPEETAFHAESITMRASDVPFFWWPEFSGTVRDIPFRGVTIGARDNVGVGIETRWSLFPLLGAERPRGVDGILKVDAFTERGAGIGTVLDWRLPLGRGRLDLYGMVDDGIDKTSTGLEVDPDSDIRGVALFEHRARLSRNWTVDLQASYISDETFITTWREDDFRQRREYETSAYFKYQKDRVAFTALAKVALQDFISNSWLLASEQRTVERVPEFSLRTYGNPVFDDALTYSSETIATRMRFNFEESTPAEIGVRGRAFGIGDDDSIADSLRAEGLTEEYVYRIDTRHELAWPFEWGAVNVTPFVVGRVTAYNDDFAEYSSDSDAVRAFGAAAIRFATQIQHVDNTVNDRVLDLHRLRHIIEPSVLLWYGYADVNEEDLPVYDMDVESLATGALVEFGLKNTWQTQRGGPGRWRSVDVLSIDTTLALVGDDANRESPSPRIYELWPEYSQLADHARGSVVWLLSDTVSVAGQTTYDLDESQIARASIGAEVRNSPDLTTYAEYRYLEASGNELLGVGWNYRLTAKYRLDVSPQWDFREEEFRALGARVIRTFPDFTLAIIIRHDAIRDDTTVGASMRLVEF